MENWIAVSYGKLSKEITHYYNRKQIMCSRCFYSQGTMTFNGLTERNQNSASSCYEKLEALLAKASHTVHGDLLAKRNSECFLCDLTNTFMVSSNLTSEKIKDDQEKNIKYE
jgi:hypothetical protein